MLAFSLRCTRRSGRHARGGGGRRGGNLRGRRAGLPRGRNLGRGRECGFHGWCRTLLAPFWEVVKLNIFNLLLNY